MEEAIEILDKTPTTTRKLWDSSMEEALQNVARQIEITVDDLDDLEIEMVKYILLKGQQVIIEHKKGYSSKQYEIQELIRIIEEQLSRIHISLVTGT